MCFGHTETACFPYFEKCRKAYYPVGQTLNEWDMEVKFATQLRIIRKKLIATFLVFSHIPTDCTLHIS